MKNPKEVLLFNRYRENIRLELYDDETNTYKLVLDEDKYQINLGVTMFNSDENHDEDEIAAVDPSGGPYICRGFTINNSKVIKIWHTKNSDDTSFYILQFDSPLKHIDKDTLY